MFSNICIDYFVSLQVKATQMIVHHAKETKLQATYLP